ncbi:MAG: hypothetical protein H7Z38_06125 [Rubrivivax sp.]|nr:hypothetical protein [Pyrinomonadaceae bacterium]
MPRSSSRIGSQTFLLYVFVVFEAAIFGLYFARGMETPPAYPLLRAVGLIWLTGSWIRQDSRKHGVGWVWISDIGLFLYITWPFVVLYYLFKTRGARAFLTLLIFFGVYLAAMAVGAMLSTLLIR